VYKNIINFAPQVGGANKSPHKMVLTNKNLLLINIIFFAPEASGAKI